MCKFKTETKEIVRKLRNAIEKNEAEIKPSTAFVRVRSDDDIVLSVSVCASDLLSEPDCGDLEIMNQFLDKIIDDSGCRELYECTVSDLSREKILCNAIFHVDK